VSSTDLDELRRSLAGEVIGPADASYDAARVIFNALVDRRPAVIARCAGAGDVAAALDFARSNGLEVAVRGGGHNPAGHCAVDDGLVIDLSSMRRVEVDAETSIARAEGDRRGSTSIRRRRASASSLPAASSARRALAASRSAGASAT
jgi:FAD/FMN-containing dehydrogenase